MLSKDEKKKITEDLIEEGVIGNSEQKLLYERLLKKEIEEGKKKDKIVSKIISELKKNGFNPAF